MAVRLIRKARAIAMAVVRAFFVTMLAAIVALTGASSGSATAAGTADGGGPTLYFFWGDGCPHCAAAKPFLADLAARYPDLEVRDVEVYNDPEGREAFVEMAAAFGFEPTGVPTFFLGEDSWVGFSESTTGAQLEAAVARCVAVGCPDAGAGVLTPLDDVPTGEDPATGSSPPQSVAPGKGSAGGVLALPLIGEVDAAQQSLAVTTALIAFVDGFNPCSLWVLTVLIALTLRTGSRRLTVIIGLVFIAVTALVYAVFIAGLFSVLTVASIAPSVRVVVAIVAATFAAVNVKDYFWFKKGVSFTIADERKPGIYQGIRRVIARADSVPALVGGTVVLAAGVSLVEFACTAGFPVLWTNILASQGVGVAAFLLLLALYLLIYQLDELAIFGVAVVTLRSSRLEEKHGRVLKLVGGMLMLTLAVVMLVDPALMTSVGTSLVVFGVAVGATAVLLLVHRVILPRFGVVVGSEDLGMRARRAPSPRR